MTHKSLFNFPRMGNLRRYADRRDAAKQRNTRRAIAKTVEAIVGNRTVDALLREAAQPPVDLEALTLQAMEHDGVFNDYALAKFMADFDQACCHTGFLLLEIGYNRIVDWMITVEDSRGTTIGNAKLVFRVQHPRLHEACKEASDKIRAAFPDWFKDGIQIQPQALPPIQDISQFGSTYCTLHRVTTVGNFCSACEHEAANARVPVSKATNPAPVAHDVRSGDPRLFEIGAMINRTTVICAVSEKDALEHVSDWEQTWEQSSDFIGISDVQVTHTRLLASSPDNWQAEAHEITKDAQKALTAASEPQKEANTPAQGFLFCEKHGTRIKDACMQFCPECEVEALDRKAESAPLGCVDGGEGGVR